MSKEIISGLEGSGKSLKLAMIASDIAHRNGKWFKKQMDLYEKQLISWNYFAELHKDEEEWFERNPPPKVPSPRPIYSNLLFSQQFFDYATKELGIPIFYWNSLDQLIEIEQADVFIDEVGNYFDARMWSELSLDVRRWLTQGSKMGIELYGTAQDFAQVDKAFRRLCTNLVHVTKVIGSPRPSATKPPVNKIWGVCMTRNLEPQSYNEDKKKFSGGMSLPGFFLIEKQYCDLFDTTQKILRSAPPPLKHIERFCGDDNCSFHKTVHV